MLYRSLAAGALLCSVLAMCPAADPFRPVPERFLIGDWVSMDGSLALELRADFQAILTVIPAQPNAQAERHFGRFVVKDRVWTVRLTDLDHREESFAASSLGLNILNLIRPDGTKTTYQRIGIRFGELDVNHDGVLDADEVKGTRLGLHFLATDVNRDGVISPAEFLAYWRRNPPPVVVKKP